MPNTCSPRSGSRRSIRIPIEQSIRSCGSEAVLESTLCELREELARVDRMIRVLEWADTKADGVQPSPEAASEPRPPGSVHGAVRHPLG